MAFSSWTSFGGAGAGATAGYAPEGNGCPPPPVAFWAKLCTFLGFYVFLVGCFLRFF